MCVCVLSNSTAISCPIWLKFWTKLWIAKEQRVSRFRVPILSNFWFYVTFLSVTPKFYFITNQIARKWLNRDEIQTEAFFWIQLSIQLGTKTGASSK